MGKPVSDIGCLTVEVRTGEVLHKLLLPACYRKEGHLKAARWYWSGREGKMSGTERSAIYLETGVESETPRLSYESLIPRESQFWFCLFVYFEPGYSVCRR